MLVHFNKFRGMIPKTAERKIPMGYAVEASNARLWSMELEGFRVPLSIFYPKKTGPIRSIFKLGDVWLHWPEDVDVVNSPRIDAVDRVHYTGHYNPKSTDIALADSGGSGSYPEDWYRLGLPAPDVAPSIVVTGGAPPAETRSYVYCYVTAWGEVGPPSPTASTTGNADGSWDLSNMDAAPPNSLSLTSAVLASGVLTLTSSVNHKLETGEYVVISGTTTSPSLDGTHKVTRVAANKFSIVATVSETPTSWTCTREAPIQTASMVKWIYRTDANGVFRFVAEIPAANTTYSDTLPSTGLAEALVSTLWSAPPGNLSGLVVLPNGILAGFVENCVRLSEPGAPHAWPEDYDYITDTEIVGLGVVGTSIIVCTKGAPYVLMGVHPANMSFRRLDWHHGCVSKRSITNIQSGVIYASPHGLVFASTSSVDLITADLMETPEWSQYAPNTVLGALFNDRYLGFYEGGGENGDKNSGFAVDRTEPESVFWEHGYHATAAWHDLEEGKLYLVVDKEIVQFDGGPVADSFVWKSGIIRVKNPMAPSVGRVRFTALEQDPASATIAAKASAIATVTAKKAAGVEYYTGAWNGAPLNAFTVNGGPYMKSIRFLRNPLAAGAFVRVFLDDEIHFSGFISSTLPFRMKHGIRGDEVQVEISSVGSIVHDVTFAEGLGELAQT